MCLQLSSEIFLLFTHTDKGLYFKQKNYTILCIMQYWWIIYSFWSAQRHPLNGVLQYGFFCGCDWSVPKNFVGGSFFRKVAGYRLAALLEIDAGYSEYRCITSALLSEQVAGWVGDCF